MAKRVKQKPESTVPAASFKNQVLAELTDWSVAIGIPVLVAWPLAATWTAFELSSVEEITVGGVLPLPLIYFLVFRMLYDFSFESFMKGQTPGKRLLNLRLVRRNGSHAPFWAIAVSAALWFIAVIFWANFVALGADIVNDWDFWDWDMLPALTLSFVVMSALYLLLVWLLKGRRLIGTVVTQEAPAQIEHVESDTTDKPEPPGELISNIAEVSKNAKGIYFIYIGLLAFCALTVAGSADRQIVLNEPTQLPIINISVSMDGFFLLAPLLSIFFFIYFQIYLNKLRQLFYKLRSEYQKIEEDERIYPWMLNFVDQPGAGLAARFIVNFSVWWSLPLVLMILALWYLKKHEPLLGSIVGLTPLIGTLVVLSFWANKPGKPFKLARSHWILLSVVLFFEVQFFGVLMPRAFRGERLIGAWPAVNVRHENLMSKLDSELKQFKTLYRVDLAGARLQGADFTGSILNKADLRGADLRGARFKRAYLKEADLTGAVLFGTNFSEAILEGVVVDDYGKIPLRAKPDTLNFRNVHDMIKSFGFSDRLRNPSADGCSNLYELREGDDPVVIDHTTGLTWELQHNPWLIEAQTLKSAQQYILTLNAKSYAGYDDWRLPTLEEAMSLVETAASNDMYIDPVFKNWKQHSIWTSDTVAKQNVIWTVSFGNIFFSDNPFDRGLRTEEKENRYALFGLEYGVLPLYRILEEDLTLELAYGRGSLKGGYCTPHGADTEHYVRAVR